MVQQQFGAVAAQYAISPVHASGPDLTAMLDAAPHGAAHMLDVGCGTGHTALAFAPRVSDVVAIDLTEAMLLQGQRLAAEQGIANVTFQRGDVERLSFAAETFDLVTSRYSAHHYPHPDEALREIRRVLKPDGVFLLVDVVAPDDPTQDTFLNTIELLRDPSHVRDHSVNQWLAKLESAGFVGETLGMWQVRLAFDSWVERMRTPAGAVAQIKWLADGAPREVHAAFAFERDHTFQVTTGLLRGRLT